MGTMHSDLTSGAGSNCRMTCCMKTSRWVGRSFKSSMLLKCLHWSSLGYKKKVKKDGELEMGTKKSVEYSQFSPLTSLRSFSKSSSSAPIILMAGSEEFKSRPAEKWKTIRIHKHYRGGWTSLLNKNKYLKI